VLCISLTMRVRMKTRRLRCSCQLPLMMAVSPCWTYGCYHNNEEGIGKEEEEEEEGSQVLLVSERTRHGQMCWLFRLLRLPSRPS